MMIITTCTQLDNSPLYNKCKNDNDCIGEVNS